jgi:hypothetical protein
MTRVTLLLALLLFPSMIHALEPGEQARRHLARISTCLSPALAEGTGVSSPFLASQAPNQPFVNGLPPVWIVQIHDGKNNCGYVMWEVSKEPKLLEFALDGSYLPQKEKGAMIDGTPSLQQFPVPGRQSKQVASGCVPTAGASLIGYWVSHGFPAWTEATAQPNEGVLQQHAKRLRGRLHMQEFPDTIGYTSDGMALSGALPQELAHALEKDALQHGVQLRTEFQPFAFEKLKAEVNASRPVLLSCTVRLPHKPHLSWGHEVLGVGWLDFEEGQFVGIKDNFYPGTSEETVRWIYKESFESLIATRPGQ